MSIKIYRDSRVCELGIKVQESEVWRLGLRLEG